MISEKFKTSLLDFMLGQCSGNLDAYENVVLPFGSKPTGVVAPFVCLTDFAVYAFIETNCRAQASGAERNKLLGDMLALETALASYLQVSVGKVMIFAVAGDETEPEAETVFHKRAYQGDLIVLRGGLPSEQDELHEFIAEQEEYFRRKRASDEGRPSKFNRQDTDFFSTVSTKLDFASRDGERVKYDAEGNAYIRKRNNTWAPASDTDGDRLFKLSAVGGFLGAHLFYQKKILKGILYLLTCGAFGVGWILDSIEIRFGFYKGRDGRYIIPPKTKFIQAAACFATGLLLTVASACVYRWILTSCGSALANTAEGVLAEWTTAP